MKVLIWPIILLNGKMFHTPRPLLLIMQGSFCHAASQWETALHCNDVSHWLGAYTEWSLIMRPLISKNGGIHFVANMTLSQIYLILPYWVRSAYSKPDSDLFRLELFLRDNAHYGCRSKCILSIRTVSSSNDISDLVPGVLKFVTLTASKYLSEPQERRGDDYILVSCTSDDHFDHPWNSQWCQNYIYTVLQRI